LGGVVLSLVSTTPTGVVEVPSVGRDWEPLRYLTIYRAAIAAALGLVQITEFAPRALGQRDPELFGHAALVYFFLSLLFAIAARVRRPGFERQLVLQTFVDIVLLTTFMHASGGVNSGFGMLIVVAIAGASVLTHGRIAILFAAIGTLAVLAEQLLMAFSRSVPVADYTHAGLLGLTFFTTAVLAHFTARRIRVSEGLAARRAVDVANLAQLNEHIIERMQSGILVMDSTLRIHRFNAAAGQLLALTPRDNGQPMASVLPGLWALRARWLTEPRRSTYTLRMDATDREVSVSFAALSADHQGEVWVYAEDSAAIVAQAQALKLASLGRLTASIAHEIRNPLSAISHAGQLLAEEDALSGPDARLLEIMRTNANRVDDIIESVLQLSRRAPSEPSIVLAQEWLAQFVREFQAETGGDRTLSCRVDPAELELLFDSGQLRQVLWNLCENSLRHAGEKATLEIVCGVSGDGVRPFLETRDDGPGLGEEAARHIFEPFFTTRTDGNGLGLYIARELCEANRSRLALRASESGAVFRVTFPDPRRQQVAA
jgi:two-component system sensor histidine kinase PilS (NtrC family)